MSESTHSEQQAKAQLESIREMVAALDKGTDDEQGDARQSIQEDPLSVEMRSGWCSNAEDMKAEEYMILLCTGGPAVRIVGDLSEHCEPESARIEHQDWGTLWTELRMDQQEGDDVVKYARQFYFGS